MRTAPQFVEKPLRAFPPVFCSLLRAKLLSNCHWQLLILIRCATHRTCSLSCIFCQAHVLTENDSDSIRCWRSELCEAFFDSLRSCSYEQLLKYYLATKPTFL